MTEPHQPWNMFLIFGQYWERMHGSWWVIRESLLNWITVSIKTNGKHMSKWFVSYEKIHILYFYIHASTHKAKVYELIFLSFFQLFYKYLLFIYIVNIRPKIEAGQYVSSEREKCVKQNFTSFSCKEYANKSLGNPSKIMWQHGWTWIIWEIVKKIDYSQFMLLCTNWYSQTYCNRYTGNEIPNPDICFVTLAFSVSLQIQADF